MAKQRNKTKPAPTEAGQGGGPESSAPRPALWVRLLLGVWLAWHVFVLFISPFSVPPASQLVIDIAQSPAVRWYSDSLYLNHGYHFFGPEPPVNQLVRWRVTDSGGQTVAEGEFPNNSQQRPRLFYHRHMMLADQASLGPPDIAPDEWLRLSMRAYGRNLLRVHGGERVTVDCVRHNLLFPSQSQRGDDPNAPDLFIPVASIEETAAGLEQPLPVPAPPTPAAEPVGAEALPAGVAS